MRARSERAINICPENAGEAEIGTEQDDGVCDGNKEGLNGHLGRLAALFDLLGYNLRIFTSRACPVAQLCQSIIPVHNS
jgi:hypothetical protein